MKPRSLISILLALLIAGCSSTGQLTPQGQQAITTGLGIAQIALAGYTGYAAATSGGAKPSPAAYAGLAQNALFGVAALAQANVGKTPAQAAIGNGAGNSVVGSAVQAAIPQTPMTQATVNTLFSAAQKVPVAAQNPPSAARAHRLRTLYYAGRTIPGSMIMTRP